MVLGFFAVLLATLNIVGGFTVTDRMLEMFKAKPYRQGGEPAQGMRDYAKDGARVTLTVWIDLIYLPAAVAFIVALKGLSSPKHARNGEKLGRRSRHGRRSWPRSSTPRPSSVTTPPI